ncbi:cryptochrome/photolyase family protein [Actinophytocola oryzae]|uniref:Deoxyribodipyrimidine photo-lyase n=1 Tax=Actinophytocola oryzae TaxID=502181 RepID=A0A4R7W0Q3_9PSEU|nr:deoxyribodipyrimidine photo-lyase [Actinophytocola oryzae]TDV56093.1 deoxyribodipyrimidine photo-lyase [Actinophytocola oryzae]
MRDTAIVWFRRDLRVRDQPTFLAAGTCEHVVGVFVLDPALLGPAGAARRRFLFGCLRELDTALGGRLLLLSGDPAVEIPRLASALQAHTVHVAGDHGPYGKGRDEAVRRSLGPRTRLVVTGSPYAVAPGRVRTADGRRFTVFTPFSRVWRAHGWRAPAETDAATVRWADPGTLDLGGVPLPHDPPCDADLPEPGEAAALRTWREFLRDRASGYGSTRNRPDLDATSRMSPYLRFGCVHPRTLLADLGRHDGPFTTELAWRDFYAEVLDRRPDSARHNHDRTFDALSVDTGPDARRRFALWCEGRTGYPVVDAGMRQLRAEAWMHNRVRMITASFLVKDLHLPWQWGARHFMTHLVDGDLAANQHGWQWVAGCGTDAAPYVRVFNPTLQAERFDPDGDYVRRHVPELRGLTGKAAHHPPAGLAPDYPLPVVDHDTERREALTRYNALTGH